MKSEKFYFNCLKCSAEISGFKEWFEHNQKCPKCGSNRIDVIYSTPKEKLIDLIKTNKTPESLWHYFDFLPLNDEKNIITRGEGVMPIERWNFLEKFAKDKYKINCEVYIIRNDLSRATGTFKDKGASLAASVLKESGIENYVVASTGNTATAFAHYLALAKINLNVFIPEDALQLMETEIGTYGQKVFRVLGDYSETKKLASEFSEKYNFLMTGGNFDPLRVEAKKTMVYEMIRQLGFVPNLFIQALSGGTGPFAVEKPSKDLEVTGLVDNLPRFLLVQPNKCNPQAIAWKNAKQKGFPQGFENEYPIIEKPKTIIPTLATGNPKTYPAMSKLVKKSNGEIFDINENKIYDIARLVAYEKVIRIGPASAVAIGGFFDALKRSYIKEGDKIYINMGEGMNRAPEFMNDIANTTEKVDTIDQCEKFCRNDYKKIVWYPFNS